MDMGLGKTAYRATELQQRRKPGLAPGWPCGVPNSLKSGWKEEIEKHGANVYFHPYESGGFYNKHFLECRS